ncbi:hypothetical protein [Vibrio sinaloensis]|uniref:hypothetical protein n=1 Tax=Photobacterium sp. (strain ATCC 43367) TaxID=379097 RepID=UPI00204EB74A|nr:hypothetical protein [Vibrio sinaloensis]UPQ87071.1 hypothetical protein MTO69_08500 [Vibrio sinaloensis]
MECNTLSNINHLIDDCTRFWRFESSDILLKGMLDLEDTKMIVQVLSTSIAFIVVGIIVSPQTPLWLNWIAYGYLFLMISVGLFLINAERIARYLEKKLDEMRKDHDS